METKKETQMTTLNDRLAVLDYTKLLTPKERTRAYAVGVAAFENDEDVESNPYSVQDAISFVLFRTGWYDAQFEYETEQEEEYDPIEDFNYVGSRHHY